MFLLLQFREALYGASLASDKSASVMSSFMIPPLLVPKIFETESNLLFCRAPCIICFNKVCECKEIRPLNKTRFFLEFNFCDITHEVFEIDGRRSAHIKMSKKPLLVAGQSHCLVVTFVLKWHGPLTADFSSIYKT